MLLVVAMLCGMCVVPVGATDLTDEFCCLYPECAAETYDSFYWSYYKCYDGNELTYDYDSVSWSVGMMIRSLWEFSLENIATREDCERCKDGIYYSVYEKSLLEELVLNKFNLDLDYMISFIKGGDAFDIFEYDGYIYLSTYGVGDGPYELYVNDYKELGNGDIYVSYYYAYDSGYNNSGNIYAVLKNENVAGKEIVGYRYLGTTPPSEELLAQYGYSKININVTLNGNKIKFDNKPVMINGCTLVPMRAIFEAMGCDIFWDGNSNPPMIEVRKNNKTIMDMWIGEKSIQIGGCDWITADVEPMLINGITYVPVRIIAESLNYNIEWNNSTNTVEISSQNKNFVNSSNDKSGNYYFFSYFDDYNGTTYALDLLGTNGCRRPCYGNVQPMRLPGTLQDTSGGFSNFVIYNNRFYCLTGGGSDVGIASIYSFDMNGNDVKLIADDATNYSTCYIYNNELYYNAWATKYYEYDDYYDVFDQYYDGGVYKIDLETKEKTKVANESEIKNYFSNTIYKNFQNSKIKDLYFNVEVSPDCQYMYYTDYDKTRGGSPIYYFDSISKNEKFVLMEERTYAISVRDKYLFYTIEEPMDNGNWQAAHVYRIPRPDLAQEKTNVKLILNTNEQNLTNPAVMRNERVMVLLREICEKIGGKVSWDGNTNTATVVCDNRTAKFVVGDTNVYVNGLGRNIDVPTQFINDSLYIPVRALTEAFSDKVEWEDPNIVKINHYKKRTYNAYLDKKKFSIEMDMSGDIPVVDAEAMCKKLGFIYKKIDSKTISIQKGDRIAIIKEGDPIYESAGALYIGTSKANDMEGIPYMKNGKMMIPTHNICRRFDCKEYQNTYYETDSVSYNIYFSTPEEIIPSYTETEEYNKFIYAKIKVDNAYVYLKDYDNDGSDEAFAFYHPKDSSSKWNCMFFDFTENNFKNESVFTDESFGELSFEFEDVEDKKILVMCSDNDYLKLYYGFGVNDEKYIYKAGYGIADSVNFNIHSENDYITTAKYDYLDGVKYDYSKNDVKIRRLLPQEEDRYWEMNIIEVSPDFIKTFKNGEEIYKIYIDKYLNRGDKVQVLYAPNATMYINYKHFDKENGRIENRYEKLWVGNSVKNKLESGGSGQGNYPKGTFWWWMPTIFIDDNDIARQYECDTEEYFEDNSTWQNETKNESFKNLIIFFNGKKLELTREVQMNNDRTMYPFRECMEFMGAKVTWNEANQEASATLNGNTVVFKINSNHYTVNGVEKEMDVNAYVDTDATYVPIRYAAEALGYKVDWVPSAENDVIAIGDNEEVSNEIEDYVSGYKDLSSTTAKIGKGVYDMIMKSPDEQLASMRKLQTDNKSYIDEFSTVKDRRNSILDLSTLFTDATIALAKTYAGDAKAGVDFIAGHIAGKTAEYISDELLETMDSISMDELVMSMCNSAYKNNLTYIDIMENYCNQTAKMDTEAYTEFLMLYQNVRMNNRTLKMGVEYFSEDFSNNYLESIEKVTQKIADSLLKDIVIGGIKSDLGFKESDNVFDALTKGNMSYSVAKNFLNDSMLGLLGELEKTGSKTLISYSKDMKKLSKDFQDMCLK